MDNKLTKIKKLTTFIHFNLTKRYNQEARFKQLN